MRISIYILTQFPIGYLFIGFSGQKKIKSTTFIVSLVYYVRVTSAHMSHSIYV